MTDQRDDKGRFKTGNKASPGRPPRRVESDMHDVLVEVARKHWKKISEAMATEAAGGNVYAARYLAEYAIGKPIQTLELRAGDQALLAELLRHFEARGMSASAVFSAMLQQIIEENETVDDGR